MSLPTVAGTIAWALVICTTITRTGSDVNPFPAPSVTLTVTLALPPAWPAVKVHVAAQLPCCDAMAGLMDQT
jgi:hypothetical protein